MNAKWLIYSIFILMIINGTNAISQNTVSNFTIKTNTDIQIKTFWDHTNAYWYLIEPTNIIVSYWTFPNVQSYRTTGQGIWQNEIPVSLDSSVITGSKLIQNYTLDSGSKLSLIFEEKENKVYLNWPMIFFHLEKI